MLKTLQIQAKSRAWLFPLSKQPEFKCWMLITTIITLVAKGATLDYVWLNFRFCNHFGKADSCGWRSSHLRSISEVGALSVHTPDLMNLAGLAGTVIPQHATFTQESLIYRENSCFAWLSRAFSYFPQNADTGVAAGRFGWYLYPFVLPCELFLPKPEGSWISRTQRSIRIWQGAKTRQCWVQSSQNHWHRHFPLCWAGLGRLLLALL